MQHENQSTLDEKKQRARAFVWRMVSAHPTSKHSWNVIEANGCNSSDTFTLQKYETTISSDLCEDFDCLVCWYHMPTISGRMFRIIVSVASGFVNSRKTNSVHSQNGAVHRHAQLQSRIERLLWFDRLMASSWGEQRSSHVRDVHACGGQSRANKNFIKLVGSNSIISDCDIGYINGSLLSVCSLCLTTVCWSLLSFFVSASCPGIIKGS